MQMQNDLQLLISELQQEADLLQHELTKCLEDTDYDGAKWYQKVLGYTLEKLRILRALEQPNYDTITDLKEMITRMKNLDIEKSDPTNAHIHKIVNDRQIHSFEEKLNQLERRVRKYQLDSDQIAGCIEDLLARRIETLSIELPQTTATINLRLTGEMCLIELVGLDNENYHIRIRHRGPGDLKRMGFEFTKHKAIKRIDNFTGGDIPNVLQLLARIMFDVFGLYGDQMAILRVDPSPKL
jgi:hypothetical protein